MNIIERQTLDEERALYGKCDMIVNDCRFDGPADGESAFKECSNVCVNRCFFNLRYPFWHNRGLTISDSEMTELCRAALWYSQDITITGSKLHGIKALRECSNIHMENCDIISPEFGWSARTITVKDCTAQSEYFMMRSENLHFSNLKLKGKYSFQYIEHAVFENCEFETKDAFWHGKNIIVKDSLIKGEYLAWYSENLTLQNCKIVGTQPLCYCRGLKLINCELIDADLCFEKSDVTATILNSVISIKNPSSGVITVPSVQEVVWDDKNAAGQIVIGGQIFS